MVGCNLVLTLLSPGVLKTSHVYCDHEDYDPQGMMDKIMRVLEAHSVTFERKEHFLVLCTHGEGRAANLYSEKILRL